jgi:predicted nucleic acid-binding protein
MGSLNLPVSGLTYLDTSPIDVLRDAAQLRADTSLKTPDAIHAATALAQGCVQFITNDPAFRRITGLNVVVVSELI